MRKTIVVATSALAILATSPAKAIVDGVCQEARAFYGGVVRLGGPNFPYCSGVLLSETLVLTAAHCIDDLVTNGEVSVMMHLQRQGSRQTPCITVGNRAQNLNECVTRQFEVAINPGYRPGDPQSDIAILHLKNNRLRFRDGSAIPTTHFARLYADRWQRSRNTLVAGFGPCNPSGAGWGEYHETRIRQVDFDDFHFTTNAGPNSRLCKGDSGGPAFLREAPQTHPVVTGLSVSFRQPFFRSRHTDCTQRGKRQRWVKVSPKVDWISQNAQRFTGRPCRVPNNNTIGVDYRLCFD